MNPRYPKTTSYKHRQGAAYYEAVRKKAEAIGREIARLERPGPLVEVGCLDCTLIQEIKGPWTERISIDIESRPRLKGVRAYVSDFMELDPLIVLEEEPSLVYCLEVLEHVDDPISFAERLCEWVGHGHLIVTIPYKWGPTPLRPYPKELGYADWVGHKHDHLDESHLTEWIGVEPHEIQHPGSWLMGYWDFAK